VKLTVDSVQVHFGAVHVLSDVCLDVASGERRAVIGPNGAGKSTLFNVIAGDRRPDAGRIELGGRDVTRLPSWRRSQLGLARTFQRSTLFPELSVDDNLALAVRARAGGSWSFWNGARERRVRAEVRARLVAAGLAELASRPARGLGHGEQRALEIEIALTAEPRLLLLDEPMAGLSGAERERSIERLRALPSTVTIIIIEHDLDAVFALAERITVLDHGVKIADGTPPEIRGDRRVQEVYLGVG
jgi:branched-chain amino acid transport system ATP-binding protein